MRNLNLVISLLFFGASYSNAQVNIQELVSAAPTGPSLNGTVVSHNASGSETIHMEFGVTNIAGTDKYYGLQLVRIIEQPTWTGEQECWGFQAEGSCYTSPTIDPNPWTAPAWGSPLPNNSTAQLFFHITATSLGQLHYRYYVLEGTTRIDSLDIFINPTLGIQSAKKETAAMNVYPNPANNSLTIATTGLSGKLDMRITNIFGQVVLKESMNNGKLVDVSDFKNGVYLVSVFEDGVLVQTRRVVVSH